MAKAHTTGRYPHLTSLAEVDIEDCQKIGNKAANLAKMLQNGIRVPEGYVLDDRDVEHLVNNGPDSIFMDEIMTAIDELGGDVAIRSSATVEDGEEYSMAGVFETSYAMHPSRSEVDALIKKAYKQSKSSAVKKLARVYDIPLDTIKLGIIIERLIHPLFAGVVYATDQSNNLRIQYVRGFGSSLVDGEEDGTTILVDKNSGVIQHSINFDINSISRVVLDEIIKQVGKIIHVFKNTEQDIEFVTTANDEMYAVQARPLVAAFDEVAFQPTLYDATQVVRKYTKHVMENEMKRFGANKAILHLNNFAELMPNPLQMDIGIFQSVFTGQVGTEGAIQLSRRRMMYPTTRGSSGYLYYIGGRAYESLAGDAISFYSGFPETEQEYLDTLVAEYLELVYEAPQRAIYPQMGLYLRNPRHEDLQKRFGYERASNYMLAYKKFQKNIDAVAEKFLHDFPAERRAQHDAFIRIQRMDLEKLNNKELLDSFNDILEHLRTQSGFDFDTAAHLGFYYMEALRLFLAEHFDLTPDQIKDKLSRLTQGLNDSSITEANIAIAQAQNDDDACRIAESRISHYPAMGEVLEVRHPRLAESPMHLREYVQSLRTGADYEARFNAQRIERISEQERLTRSLPESARLTFSTMYVRAQKYMALRETIKDQFTKEYALLRDRLVELGRRTGLAEDSIYYLYPSDLAPLIDDKDNVLHLIEARAREHRLLDQLDMPRVLRHDTTNEINSRKNGDTRFRQAYGQFIAPGKPVEGTIINLDDSNKEELIKRLNQFYKDGEPIVLAAKSITLTHDPFINKSSGLILQQAGFVSHGAQRARELGVGALSSIDTSLLRTGMKVSFDPAARRVKSIADFD